MKKTVFFSIYKGEKFYVAECADLPIITQGETLDEVASNIQEAVRLHLEGENLAELGFAQRPIIVANLELTPEYA